MGIDQYEREQRLKAEALLRIHTDLGRVWAVDGKSEIRTAALAMFLKELDGKLANMQEGEYLSVQVRVDILRGSGKVRGGSGSQRNMPEYIEWRSAVYERDNYTCQECGSTGQLNAHHIKAWSSHPALRFDVENGVTLCLECHAEKHPHLGFFGDS